MASATHPELHALGTMATRGVFQLRGLTLRYCDLGGSSRGAREFIQTKIADFARSTPAAQVATEVKRNRHPVLRGEYVTGETKVMDVKNKSPEEIWSFAMMLRNSSGRRITKFKKPVESRNPSIQGVWDNSVPYHKLPVQVKHSE